MKNLINRALGAKKTKIFTLFLALAASVGTLFAESGTCGANGGNLTWTLNDGVLTISGTGAMADFGYDDIPWYSKRKSIQSVVIETGVTSIGKYAFFYCSVLLSVTIPNSVTSIGIGAFWQCTSLTSMTIPNSVTSIEAAAFGGCTSLTSVNVNNEHPCYSSLDGVLFNKEKTLLILYPGGKQGEYTIPNSVTCIEDYAFDYCTGLTSVTIPNSVTSIGGCAFDNCTSLTSIEIPNSVTSIGASAFSDCKNLSSITIPNSVKNIGNYAFSGCTSLPIIDDIRYADTYLIEAVTNLSSYTIKEGTRWIGSGAFYRCTNLTSIVIPDGVTSIGYGAFKDCSSLTSVTIPNSVTSIGYDAFYYCNNLGTTYNAHFFVRLDKSYAGKYSIPAGIESIIKPAFYDCKELTAIEIPSSVTYIEEAAFDGCSSLTAVYTSDITAWCNIDFEEYDSNPLETADNLYLNGELVTNLIIPSSVIEIKQYAFTDCQSLSSVTIYKGCKTIGKEAFGGCNNITSITFPSTLDSIGDFAFDCGKLRNVYNYAVNPQDMSSYTGWESLYRGILSTATLYVPESSINLYRNAYFWCYFGNILPLQTPEEAIDEVNVQDDLMNTHKILRDGKVFIQREGKVYTLQGQEVR